MKIIFGYYEDENLGMTEYSEIEFSLDETKESAEKKANYKKYLLTAIMEDFPFPEILVDFYDEVKSLEKGEIEYLEWDGQSFQHELTREKVKFTHTIFGECEEYPVWECKFKEYRKVLKAWKEFITMPRRKQNKLEVTI